MIAEKAKRLSVIRDKQEAIKLFLTEIAEEADNPQPLIETADDSYSQSTASARVKSENILSLVDDDDDNDKEGARIQHQVSTTTIVNEIATSDEQHFNQS